MKQTTAMRRAAVVLLAFVLAAALLCGLTLGTKKQADAADDFGKITVHNHAGGMLGITIEGVESAGPVMPGQDDFGPASNKAAGDKIFRDFFGYLYLNGMPVFNWYHEPTKPSGYATGQYMLGGYTYLIGTEKTGFAEGDVVYFKKGFRAIYRTDENGSDAVDAQALTETALQYDRYFVYDGYDFQPADILVGVSSSQNSLTVGNTVILTPKFRPMKFTFYSTSPYATLVGNESFPFDSFAQDRPLDAWDYPTDAKQNYWCSRLSKEMVYESSDESVATVDAAGVVTGVKPGRVRITARHADSSETKTVELLVRGSAAEAEIPAVESADGKLVIATGVPGTAAATLTVAEDAFAMVEKNGAPLFAGGATVSLAADGRVTTDIALAAGDLIRFRAGWQALISTDGATASLADGTLSHDRYYRFDGTAFASIAPFSLSAESLELQVRGSAALTPAFADGVTDTELVWKSSASYLVAVDQSGVLTAKNFCTGAVNRWKDNENAPTDADRFPEAVTVTATHPGTGETATCTVTVKETLEEMKIEAALVDAKTVGFKFIGKTSGRLVTSDFMSDTQDKYNPLPMDGGERSNRAPNYSPNLNSERYYNYFLKIFHNDKSLQLEAYGATAPSNNLGGKTYSATICTNYYDFADGDLIFVARGLRPFAYRSGFGFFYDSMELKYDACFRVQGGKLVAVTPYSFAAESYTVKADSSVSTSLETLVDDWAGTYWGLATQWEYAKIPGGRDVTYAVEDETVASVDEKTGVITGVKAGTTNVILTDGAGLTATAAVTVNEKTTVALPDAATVVYGKDGSVTLSTNDENADFVWTADSEIVTVTGSGTRATLHGNGLGTAVLTVTADGGAVSDTMTVTVVPDLTASLPGGATSLEVGKTLQIAAFALPEAGVTITYASDKTANATVSATGLVTGVKKTSAVTITVTAAKSDDAAVKAEQRFTLEIFQVETFTFSKVETAGGGVPLFYYDGALMGLVATEGVQSVFWGEEHRDDFGDFSQHILITEPGQQPLAVNDYWHTRHQLQIHSRNERLEFYWFDLDKDSDGKWDYGNQQAWHSTVPPDGTILTFEAGMRLIWGNKYGNYYANYMLGETTQFKYVKGAWKILLEEGSPFNVLSMGEVKSNEFMLTFNVDTTNAVRGETLTESDKIKLNGYTLSAINAANQKQGAVVFVKDGTMTFSLNPEAVMDGKKIFATEDGLTLEFVAGYALPTTYVCEDGYKKAYYPELKWWAGVLNEPVSEEVLTVRSVVQRPEGVNQAFVVIFGNENKVFRNIDSAGAGAGSVHVGAVPAWFTLTQWYGQLDEQISSGTKQALWHGIFLNDESIYDIMFNSGASTIELQSTIAAIHFSYTDNAMRFVFDDRCADINGLDWTKKVTLRFDADVFHTDTGAKFAEDAVFVYTPGATGSGTWKAGYEVTLTADAAVTVKVGQTVTVQASVATLPGGGDATLRWSTADATIATVENGVVTGKKVGSVDITVTAADGTKKVCRVTVTPADEQQKPDDKPEKGGCKGAGLGGVAGLGGGLALLLAGSLLLRKKRSR